MLLPLWDLKLELFHKNFENIINFGVNHESSLLVVRSLLKVDDDELASIVSCLSGNLGCSLYSHTGTNYKHDISHCSLNISTIQEILIVVLTKVEDGVLEIAIATLIVTLSSSLVVVDLT